MAAANVSIRVATPEDASALLAIYEPYVSATAVSFEYDVPSLETFTARIERTVQNYPYLVIEQEGRVCGYAYASEFKARKAYQHSVENTIYLHKDAQGKGLGRMLYTALENILYAQNVKNLYACIASTDDENDPFLTNASPRFHEHMGYRLAGSYAKCGYKFDRWYNMVWMEKLQGVHEASPKRPDDFVPFSQLDAEKVRKYIESALQGESESARCTQDSAGAVVFRNSDEGPKVLMITMRETRHSFPKGHICLDESLEQCAVREVAEETGVLARILPGFSYTVPSARPEDARSVHFFLAEAQESDQEPIPQLSEVENAFWACAETAAELVTFEADRMMYEKAWETYQNRHLMY